MNADGIEEIERTSALARVVDLALKVLSLRALALIQLVLNAAAFGWALGTESPMRLAVATVFAAANWCVVHVKPKENPHGS